MKRYNKAYAGGVGTAIAMIVIWAVEAFGGVDVPPMVENAAYIIGAGLGPLAGPANKP